MVKIEAIKTGAVKLQSAYKMILLCHIKLVANILCNDFNKIRESSDLLNRKSRGMSSSIARETSPLGLTLGSTQIGVRHHLGGW